jgi:hypothetical protein
MYTYEIRHRDNTTEYVNAIDIQNACSVANCRMDEVMSVSLIFDLKEEEYELETNN